MSAVCSVCLSSDGRWALAGGERNTLSLFNVESGRHERTFEGHGGPVTSVCLSPDGHWALSGSMDKTLRLWKVESGCCVRVFEGHTGFVQSVCLSLDCRWALSASSDGTVRLWELDWEFEAHGLSDWDERARPWLVSFLTRHTPLAGQLPPDCAPAPNEVQAALTRRGRPVWTDADLQGLMRTLACAGDGWLRPEGVRKKLEEMAANWQGPPPLPWEKRK